jgi:hypothetical protein
MIGSSESWGLNSTHLHGTHVPVEEPSTASTADTIYSRSYSILGEREQEWRNLKAQRLGGPDVEIE